MEPGGLQSMGVTESNTTDWLSTWHKYTQEPKQGPTSEKSEHGIYRRENLNSQQTEEMFKLTKTT